MIWAIPIISFIGTVWGISTAIGQLNSDSGNVNDTAILLQNIPEIMYYLSAAFDTTFLALSLSVPLMLFVAICQRQEESYLLNVDETWKFRLLGQLRTLHNK